MKITPSICSKSTALRASRANPVLFLWLLLLAVLVPSSFGQGITGSITGTITDSSGATLGGVSVTVTQVETNSAHTVTTSDAGVYRVPQLAPGHYTVKVEKAGFKSYEQNGFVLAIDQVAAVDAKLELGSEQQTVTVTSQDPVIQTEDSSVGAGGG